MLSHAFAWHHYIASRYLLDFSLTLFSTEIVKSKMYAEELFITKQNQEDKVFKRFNLN